jgi:hypothetical protein
VSDTTVGGGVGSDPSHWRTGVSGADSTVPEGADLGSSRRGAAFRALTLSVMAMAIVAVCLGAAGPTTRVATAESASHRLTVSYPERTRPGLAAPMRIDVQQLDGEPFAGPITITATSSYLNLFDENGTDPQPDASTSDGVADQWTFEPAPDSATFAVSFDMRTQPTWHWPGEATVGLVIAGEEVASVEFTTYVLP